MPTFSSPLLLLAPGSSGHSSPLVSTGGGGTAWGAGAAAAARGAWATAAQLVPAPGPAHAVPLDAGELDMADTSASAAGPFRLDSEPEFWRVSEPAQQPPTPQTYLIVLVNKRGACLPGNTRD